MSQKDAYRMAKSVDPDQIATVCPGISVRKHRIITVLFFPKLMYLLQQLKTLIRGSILENLIWVYTVCQCTFYGLLGINGLSFGKIVQSSSRTVNFLNIRTPKKFVVITLKVEQDSVSLSVFIQKM